MTPADLIAYANSLKGTAYKAQGRNPDTGLDCLGLVIQCFDHFGEIPGFIDRTDYGRIPNTLKVLDTLKRYARRVQPIQNARQGDLAYIRFARDPQHFGLFDGQGGLIHAIEGHGVIRSPVDPAFFNRVWSVWRHRSFG